MGRQQSKITTVMRNFLSNLVGLLYWPIAWVATLLWLALTADGHHFQIMKSGPSGIYYLAPMSSTANPDDPTSWPIFGGTEVSSHLIGAAGRQTWEQLEPSEGVYNWTYLDALQAQANQWGYQWEITIGCGVDFPSWVTAAGAQTVTVHDNNGSAVTICVPWDLVFQAKWQSMIAALGARYDSDPNLRMVQMTGCGRQGECFFCSNTVSSDYAWLQANGGANAWITAAETIASFYFTAFPTTALCYSTGSPLPNTVDPNNTTMGAVIANLYASHGIGRPAQFYARDSGYTGSGASIPQWNLKNQGAQQNLPVGSAAAAQAKAAWQQPYSFLWLEVYKNDCMLQSNWNAFDQFNSNS